MFFSKRIVLVYTSIIYIPLILLVFIVTTINLNRQIRKNKDETLVSVEKKAEDLMELCKVYNLIETMLQSDDKLTMFFSKPENSSEAEIIDKLIQEASLVEKIIRVNPMLESVRIFTDNQNIPERWPIILQSVKLDNYDRWSFDYKANFLGYLNNQKKETLCSTRRFYRNYTRKIGYLQISVLMEKAFPYLYEENENSEINNYILINDYVENSLVQFKNDKINEIYPTLKEKELAFIYKKINDKSDVSGVFSFMHGTRILAWSFVPDLNIYIVEINYGHSLVIRFISSLLSLLLLVILLFFALYKVVNSVTSRMMGGIYTLINGLQQVKEGNISVQLPINGIDEVSDTQETFNSMTKKLAEQIEQIKFEQKLVSDTEMKAMQNQINAHFLYNVLETLRMQAILNDENELAESLHMLGKMMRYCLRWRIHKVELSQEIDYIIDYVGILNLRNDYKISLDIDIPQELMKVEIPKMTLQPLIENAFVHSVEKMEMDANIKVFSRVSKEEKRVYFGVQDFGLGIDEQTLNGIRSYLLDDSFEREATGSIGLKNIQQRLNVFYGKSFRVIIESKLNEGTTIIIPIPYEGEKE